MIRTCETCGVEFVAQRSDARFHNDACRKRAARRPRPVSADGVREPSTRLVEATARDLEAAGLLHTVEGQLALIVAERIAAAGETSSGVAALSKEFSRLMADIWSAHRGRSGFLDELQARRDRKRGQL